MSPWGAIKPGVDSPAPVPRGLRSLCRAWPGSSGQMLGVVWGQPWDGREQRGRTGLPCDLGQPARACLAWARSRVGQLREAAPGGAAALVQDPRGRGGRLSLDKCSPQGA